AASSPIMDGLPNGILDNRLVVYRGNCAKIPSITGQVVPEAIGSIGEYHERLLEKIYRDLEPHDPERVLRHEWVNARGAIARFDRMAIEIRVLDVQETPFMDVAYAALIVEVLKLLVEERWADRRGLDAWHENELGKLLELAERRGEDAGVSDRRYLAALGFRGSSTNLLGLWEHLAEQVSARGTLDVATGRKLEHYLRHGTLATRIAKAVGLLPTHQKIERVYAELCEALASGEPFAPHAPAPPPR
ncbi:MAG TPA: glutamate-cysteine ligase family protein, partial [Gammaproteobacteria bacterium]|nr:glutamate-cysteine ligase family protein [Gammaproteobacteria bacterium]